MEMSLMGRVLVGAKIENLSDLHHVETGSLGAEQVRSIEVTDALVDSGSTSLAMPKRLIDPAGQRLIGNPAHGGEQMIELY